MVVTTIADVSIVCGEPNPREITKGIDALENPAIHLASVKINLMLNELYEGIRFE